ncbi:DUF475 domain-containing protein [Roseibium sp.]|uniref:DUF475 domain-containing protein n=1 Tax=Roseibium sp. TaxID=1936156 RepID=UPI003D0E2473
MRRKADRYPPGGEQLLLFRYFRWSFTVTAIGLVLTVPLGYHYSGGWTGALHFLFVGAVLAVLEISLSFDNAIVNANRLQSMTAAWRQRFLTWGILIAVFGMRLVFPVAVVSFAAWINPVEAVVLAINSPKEYALLIQDAHLSISAFGGAFLMMVALGFFIDEDKDVDWLLGVERTLRRCTSVRGLAYGFVLAVVLTGSLLLPVSSRADFMFAALLGLLTHVGVDALSHLLDRQSLSLDAAKTGGIGAFLYLEVLDASFSFDGVIGAFALTQNLLLIAIGLGIGAMYVRSMTLMLVERETLARFRYLEHGAFYSILALSLVMFAQGAVHVPEALTGLAGTGIIIVSLFSSIRYNRRRVANEDALSI